MVYATTDKKPINTVQETQQEVVSVVGNKVYITAKAGEEINIFALTGQNVYRTLSKESVGGRRFTYKPNFSSTYWSQSL